MKAKSTALKMWVLLCFLLYCHHPAKWRFKDVPSFFTLICAAFPLKRYVSTRQKWQDTFRLQRSAVLALSAALGLAHSDVICLGLLQKAYFLSRFAVIVYVWSLYIFGFVSLPTIFWTRACLCICVCSRILDDLFRLSLAWLSGALRVSCLSAVVFM